MNAANTERARRLRALATRTAVLFGLWAVLVEGRPSDLPPGLPVALLAGLFSLWLDPPRRRRTAWPVLSLVPRLAWMSLVGGFDVAMRALRPGLRIDPDLVEHRLEPPDERVAVALSYATTVMPGTLVAQVSAERLCVHVLDRRQPVAATFRDLERRLRRGLDARGGADA